MPAGEKGGGAMNYVRLTPEQQRVVCEDLLAIERAGRLPDVWQERRLLVREQRCPSPWQQVEIDRLAQEASNLVGGSRWWWREAAAAALGFPSRADASIEAVCLVADDVRWQQQKPEPEPAPASDRERPRHRATLGSRKRGGR
jgi:hypothetical protein